MTFTQYLIIIKINIKLELELKRKKTKVVKIGSVSIGRDYPIAIQSMTKTKTRDIESTVRQIKKLKKNGCDIIRCAVPDQESAKALKEIKKMFM